MNTTHDTIERIKKAIADNSIMLFMKGTPMFPQCGFSSQVVRILDTCGVKYGHINVLEEQDVRQELPKYANWPTFPQLYVNGQLIGGCDIVTEMYEAGELQQLLAPFKG